MDFGRRRGVVTGVILVLIVAAASLIMNLVRSLYSRCEKQRFLWQAELKCTLFTGHPVRRVHFALYD